MTPAVFAPPSNSEMNVARKISSEPRGAKEQMFAAPVKVDRPASVVHVGGDRYLLSLKKCGYVPEQLDQYLELPHGTKRGTKRYLYEGAWYNHAELQTDFALAKDAILDEVMCIVLHVEDELPCLGKSCLLEIFIRKGTSDVKVVQQLLESGEYNFLQGYYPRTILDAGGNIGLASRIFSVMWPDARIIALEPSTRNFDILKKNVRTLLNVVPIHVGLWQRPAKLLLHPPGPDNEWGFKTTEVEAVEPKDGDLTLYGLNVELLMDAFQIDSFDYLKIDIEGSEEQVFTPSNLNSMDWVNNSILVSIEIHTPSAEQAIGKVMGQLPHFEKRIEGEYNFWRNVNREAEITVVPVTEEGLK